MRMPSGEYEPNRNCAGPELNNLCKVAKRAVTTCSVNLIE